MTETSRDQPLEHEGQKYLSLIGLGHLADEDIVMRGVSRKARDFLDDEACAKQARPAFIAFADMQPTDPKYDTYLQALRGAVAQYINVPQEG